MSIVHKMTIWSKQHNLIPSPVQRIIQKHTNVLDLRTAAWIAKNPYANDSPASTYPPKYPYKLGILKEFWHGHHPYIAACREIGVAYHVVDITAPDWLEQVYKSGCDAFLVRPSASLSIWKQMYDERLRVMVQDQDLIIYPTYEESWVYESKRRMCYWLKAYDVPHPKTWIFYDFQQALMFAEQTELPLVYKSDLGSGASGVRILRKRKLLKRHIRRCFKSGFTTYRRGRNDKEWGFIFLQEYLPEVREWRIARIGDSYFGYEKLKKGDYHSGSLQRQYGPVPSPLLDFVRSTLDIGRFRSMALDVFETSDGQYLVNKMQTVFGMSQDQMAMVGGRAGRWRLKAEQSGWVFEEGDFCQNDLCNMRVRTLLAMLDKKAISREKQHA